MLCLFSTAYPPFPQKQTYSRAARFLWASFICWHQWIYTTDECGCLCLILVMMAAVRFDVNSRIPSSVTLFVFPTGFLWKQLRWEDSAEACTAGLSLLLKSSTKVQSFLLHFLAGVSYDPRQKGEEVGQRKHPHRKEGSFKTKFWIYLREETWWVQVNNKRRP